MKHGTVHTYNYHKCRCDSCREVASEYRREQRRKLENTVPPEHGLVGYKHYRCRCDDCRAAYSAYVRNRRRENKDKGITPATHGIGGYTDYGCKCDICWGAELARRRRQEQSKKDRAQIRQEIRRETELERHRQGRP